jgi:hypothetical protein
MTARRIDRISAAMQGNRPEMRAAAPVGSSDYPLERQIEYVVALAGLGWICGYIGWAFRSLLLPAGAEKPKREDWTATGMGLAGAAGISWFFFELVLH